MCPMVLQAPGRLEGLLSALHSTHVGVFLLVESYFTLNPIIFLKVIVQAGMVDEPQYTLCLLESEALDHQVTVGAIYGAEHIHISTLRNSVSTT